MKYLLIILTLFAYQIYSEPLPEETFLSCEIKDQQILSIEQGIPKRYSGYTDTPEKGETIQIKVSYGLKKFFLETPQNVAMNLFSMGWTDNVEISKKIENYSVVNAQSNIQINEDYMDISDNILNRVYTFKRYYKNDWQMKFSNTSLGYTVVANCMNQSGFQRILAYYKKHAKK